MRKFQEPIQHSLADRRSSRVAAAHCDQTAVGGWPGPCGVPLQATVPGWVYARDSGAPGFCGPAGRTGSQTPAQSDAFPRGVPLLAAL